MSCDYTDIIMPIDYTPEAFEFANRKLFHKWKMIGMQVSHPFVGGIQLGTSGEIARGVATGCRVIEEVNQNNHIVGRGTWYFRAKSDAPEIDSAAYGIIGHCKSPGIESNQYAEQGTVSYGMIDAQAGYGNVDAFTLEAPEFSPMYRSWGLALGREFCECNESTYWHMGVFFRDNVTGQTFFLYDPDEDCGRKDEDPEICNARNSRRTGRFNAKIEKQANYRTCEAMMLAVRYGLEGSGPCKVIREGLNSDITGTENESAFSQIVVRTGVSIKLTSLPSCNHFNKIFQHGSGELSPTNFVYNYKCERAAIRIAPSCSIGIGSGPYGNINYSTTKVKNFEVIEKHYDRWDVAEDNLYNAVTRYKIFDEVFELPEIEATVRVLAHHKSVLQEYSKSIIGGWNIPGFTIEECMDKKYVTGGKSTDALGAMRGCTCTHKGQDENHYPIRPYNEFNYCPNNFTCEKTCYD